jgi:hypothetical protein
MISIVPDAAVAAALCGLSVQDMLKTVPFQGMLARLRGSAPLENAVSMLSVGTMVKRRGLKALSNVPVFQLSPQGNRHIDVWPCITYECVSIRFDENQYVPDDEIVTPVEGSEVFVEELGVWGPGLVSVRPHPLPYILVYDIGVWTADTLSGSLLQSSVLRLIRPIDFSLSAVYMDGSEGSLPVRLTNMQNFDEKISHHEDSTRSTPCRWILTYEVEAWEDTTLETTLRRTIVHPPEVNYSRKD